MTEDELVRRHPLAWHMAEDGSWPAIWRHGLLSTAALLDLYEVPEPLRTRLLTERRPTSVTVRRDGLPDVVVRDQKPMTDAGLLKCLEDGISPAEWYGTLNAKTFFWVSRERLDRLLGARAYRGKAHVILTVDTAELVAASRSRVLLCPINSGATLYVPQTRGLRTFRPIGEFEGNVVELVVQGGVPDIRDHVVVAERVGADPATTLWRR